jgi:hypothetical protein
MLPILAGGQRPRKQKLRDHIISASFCHGTRLKPAAPVDGDIEITISIYDYRNEVKRETVWSHLRPNTAPLSRHRATSAVYLSQYRRGIFWLYTALARRTDRMQ